MLLRASGLGSRLSALSLVFASFRNTYGQDLFDRLRPDRESSQADYIGMVCTDKPTPVSIANGQISGFVVLEADVFDGIGAIELLAVDPQHAGGGIGTALNSAALRWLEQAGMAYAVVSTADDASHGPARRSYEKVGFEPMPVQWHLRAAKLS